MKVELENGKLTQIANFMYGLKLVRKQSRFRRRFIDMLQERAILVDQDRIELLKEHSKKDENREPIIHDDTYDVKDMKAFNEDLQELYSEKMVIEGGDNREMLRTIKAVLKKFEDTEYDGQQSEIYDYLCDQFGVDDEEDENDGSG
ncbi:hypothetical protein [Heyndrickxia coagulans]|uniref:DUF1617 family protein n=1 Tax=Heyndrickxia coagulans TaxID=1398 RepID=A0A150KL60_HEYCO|nr:hypothetical protein [Heyndrickxia coagulans]KYC73679.1 hypothetical protein B4099_0885 [Heyndrickxia coagulans]